LAGSLVAGAEPFPVFLAGPHDYSIVSLVHDRRGYAYVAGKEIVRLPAASYAFGPAIIARISPRGSVEWIKSFGEGVTIQALALDINGDLLMAGSAAKLDFVDSRAIQPEPAVEGYAAFIGKLNVDSGRWLFSTYFGGKAGSSEIRAMSVGKDGAIYLTGFTNASDYPTTGSLRFGDPPIFVGLPRRSAAFAAKLSPAADRILISGFFSGRSVACGCCSACFLSARSTVGKAIGLDGAGNIVIAGNTNTTDLATTEGAMRRSGIGAFVAAVKADGSGLAYLTYLGTANYIAQPYNWPGNVSASLVIDPEGDVIIAGSTFDQNFPVTSGVIQTAYSASGTPRQTDLFVAKLKRDGSGFHWGTYFGGRNADSVQSMTLDPAGRIWIAGTTESTDFPRTEGWNSSGGDFVALINQDGSKLLYSARFPSGTVAAAVSVDPSSGMAWTAGVYGYISSHVPGAPPRPAVYTAGTGIGNRTVAPGKMIVVSGGWIGPATAEAVASGALHIPTALAGRRVLFDGIPAPLLRASAHEIVAVVPFGLADRDSANLIVEAGGEPLSHFPVRVEPDSLQMLTKVNGVIFLNEDGSDNTATQPARLGSVVTLWLNGAGVVAGVDGEIVLEPRPYECCTVRSYFGQADLLYSGAAPGLVAGITQISFRIPDTIGGLVFQPPSRLIPIYVKARSPNEIYAPLFVAP